MAEREAHRSDNRSPLAAAGRVPSPSPSIVGSQNGTQSIVHQRAWRWYLAFGLFLTGAASFALRGSALLLWAILLLDAAMIAALVFGVHLHQPSRPVPWRLMIAGAAVYFVATASWCFSQAGYITLPYPSIADALYVSGYGLLLVGLGLLIRTRTQGRDRSGFLDTFILVGGIGVLAWSYLIARYFDDPSISLAAKLVSAAYPLAGLSMLAIAVRLVFLPGARRAAAAFMGVALAAQLTADTLYSLSILNGTWSLSSPALTLWMIQYSFFGAAALHPSMKHFSQAAPEPDTVATRWRIPLITLAALIPPVMLIVRVPESDDVRVIAVISAVLLVLAMFRVSDLVAKVIRTHMLLVESRQAVEKLNADLEERLTERTAELAAANRNLEQAKVAAEGASTAKSEFLSRTSHELRTPLNAILGFGQLLETSDLSIDDRHSIEQILKGGRHLLDLINEVLDISQFDTQAATLSMEPVSLTEVLFESVDLVRPSAAAHKVKLEVDTPDASWFVLADRQRLRQVLHNLLSNAVKFNREGGTVQVSGAETSGKTFAIRVVDTGPGIAAEKLGRLFSPFDRLGAERTEIDGTGLGLALSKALVEAMGGRIIVESKEGMGSTFSVELEKAVPSAGAGEIDAAVGAILPPSTAGTILCVEDNAANLALIQRVLAHRPGVTLFEAREGKVGVKLAREHNPSLVLLDLNLPDISGEEALRILREDQRTRDIRVAVISADATPTRIARLLDAGADAYLTKPLKVKELLDLVDETLAPAKRSIPAPANSENS